MLTGSGTAGAYHAGVLRALHEAGVKIDLVAGRGAGAIGALFAAVDGGARLWEASGLWKSRSAARFYQWRAPLRAAGWALAAAAAVLAIPLALVAAAVVVGVLGLLMTLVGLEGPGDALRAAFGDWIDTLFAPASLPTVIPRLVLFAILIGLRGAGSRADRIGTPRTRETPDPLRHDVAPSGLAALRCPRRRSEPDGVVEPDSRRGAAGGPSGG